MKPAIEKPSDRWALVTGARGSVGGASVRGLVRRNFKIVAIVKDSSDLRGIAEHLRVDERTIWPVVADLGDEDSWASAMTVIRGAQVHPEVVVNTAAEFGQMGGLLDVSARELERVFSINFFGLARLANAFVPNMVESRWGRFIHFSSPEGSGQPKYGNGPYSISKAAGNRYLAHLSLELKERNVNVHAVHPGEIRSNMWRYVRDTSKGQQGLERFVEWAETTDKHPGSLDVVSECISGLLDNKKSQKLHGRFLWAQMPEKSEPLV